MNKWLYRCGWMTLGIVALYAVSALAGIAQGGSLDPPGPPGSTMKSLDDIPPSWHRVLPANDGGAGGPCQSSRFSCVMGGEAVLDRETGLVWQYAPSSQTVEWYVGVYACLRAKIGGRYGWRLPRMEEYRSLLDATGFLPVGVFTNVQAGYYWTSTIDPYPISGGQVLIHRFDAIPENGTGVAGRTGSTFYVWCVRGGTGVDGM